MEKDLLFTERQRFRQWWLWLLLLGVAAFPLVGLIRELLSPAPFSDAAETSGLIISLVVILGIVALFLAIRLETRISKNGLAVRLYPFHLKFLHYSWSELEQVYVREYSPIGDFGGWGLRYSLSGNGKAYNISGHQGIQLVFTNGKKLLIGTQKPQEAAAALAKIPVLTK